MSSRSKMVKNFIDTRGISEFRYLIESFERHESGQVIADHLGVTRERVRQWRDAFGSTVSVYMATPETQKVLRRSK